MKIKERSRGSASQTLQDFIDSSGSHHMGRLEGIFNLYGVWITNHFSGPTHF